MNELTGPMCTARVRRAFDQMEQMIENGEIETIEKLFRLEYPVDVNNTIVLDTFYATLGNLFSNRVEYGT